MKGDDPDAVRPFDTGAIKEVLCVNLKNTIQHVTRFLDQPLDRSGIDGQAGIVTFDRKPDVRLGIVLRIDGFKRPCPTPLKLSTRLPSPYNIDRPSASPF